MDHIICINKNSFPARNILLGKTLLHDAIQGALQLQDGNDRFIFYMDSNGKNLHDLEISKNFTYGDFIDSCCDIDIKSFLLEIEDKSPALDSLSETQIDEMTNYKFYMQKAGIDKYLDDYALAYALSGYMLSLLTEERWNNYEIDVSLCSDTGCHISCEKIKNISCVKHGSYHYKSFGKDNIKLIAAPNITSKELVYWFNNQSKENKNIMIHKIKQACGRKFEGGKPLFDNIKGEHSKGLREIRMSAYSGGAIRILFKKIEKENKQALLVGFIKHSNSEYYDTAIKKANNIFSKINT